MSASNEVVVVIPARGGSKGIPRKNLARVGGHPLIGRAITAARGAALVDRVVVSTDDEEIASVAHAYGAEVIERPADLSGDTASSESALTHVAQLLEEREGLPPSILALLQCTAPFTTSGDIDGTLRPVINEQADSAFAAVSFKHFVWSAEDDGRAAGVNHDGGPRVRRQDLAPQFLETGSVYAMRYDALVAEGHRFCGRTVLNQVPESHCFEIDTPTELQQAQAMAHLLDGTTITEALPERVGAVVFDFDGVFTDNAVWVGQDGQESVRCSRGDGMGIAALREAGIPLLVLSKERNPVVAARCEKLGLPVEQGVDEKRSALARWLSAQGVEPPHVVYLGNDVNDLPCLEYVGCAVGPADSHPAILGALHVRLRSTGGCGCVRELCDHILERMRG